MESNINIRPLVASDWQQVALIYKQGIETGVATFEQSIPSWEKWDESHTNYSRFVIENEKEIMGWSALSAVSGRCVYAGVCETSVYVHNDYKGLKNGKKLLEKTIQSSENEGIWTLTAGVFPENISSVELHKSLGFKILGLREKIGCLNGVWKDVLLMERRSLLVGV